jgi:large subunit ribosomal protein L18
MTRNKSRNERRLKIHQRIRNKVWGSGQRPRLCVFRSLKHTYAQLIDDSEGKTLVSASSLSVDGKKLKHGGNIAAAKKVGELIATEAKKVGIEEVVFDRGGYIFHGRVKALAEAARKAGLKF